MENNDRELIITDEAETINVCLSPTKTPIAYQRKLQELINGNGMTEKEAKEYLLQPIELELFYDYDRGLFGVESEAVDAIEVYNPYTGKEIPRIFTNSLK